MKENEKEKIITSYSEIPNILIVGFNKYRGGVSKRTIPKPEKPHDLPPYIFILKDGQKGNLEEHYEKVEINLSKGIDPTLPQRENDPLSLKIQGIQNLQTTPAMVYIDDDMIQKLYSTYSPDILEAQLPIIEKVVMRRSAGGQLEAEVGLPKFVSIVFQDNELIDFRQTINYVERNVDDKYKLLIKELVKRGQVVLDLEFENKKSKDLEKFDSLINSLESDFKVLVDSTTIESVRGNLGRQTIKESLRTLEETYNKLVLIHAKFEKKVDKDAQSEEIVYNFNFSKLIKGQDNQSVEVQFSLKASDIRSRWQRVYAKEPTKTINLFGTIYESGWKDEDPNTWLIRVMPYAVHP
ncbi:MAG: hypothetical protein R2824_15930 [Saprospiraceae bacterium]